MTDTPSFYLSKVSVSNFLSFGTAEETLDIPQSGSLLPICGPNSAGKTNLLIAMKLALEKLHFHGTGSQKQQVQQNFPPLEHGAAAGANSTASMAASAPSVSLFFRFGGEECDELRTFACHLTATEILKDYEYVFQQHYGDDMNPHRGVSWRTILAMKMILPEPGIEVDQTGAPKAADICNCYNKWKAMLQSAQIEFNTKYWDRTRVLLDGTEVCTFSDSVADQTIRVYVAFVTFVKVLITDDLDTSQWMKKLEQLMKVGDGERGGIEGKLKRVKWELNLEGFVDRLFAARYPVAFVGQLSPFSSGHTSSLVLMNGSSVGGPVQAVDVLAGMASKPADSAAFKAFKQVNEELKRLCGYELIVVVPRDVAFRELCVSDENGRCALIESIHEEAAACVSTAPLKSAVLYGAASLATIVLASGSTLTAKDFNLHWKVLLQESVLRRTSLQPSASDIDADTYLRSIVQRLFEIQQAGDQATAGVARRVSSNYLGELDLQLRRVGTGHVLPARFAPAGVQQTLLLLIALYAQPSARLILLDEPTTALHPPKQRLLERFLRDFAQKNGVPILFTTHSMEMISAHSIDTTLRVHMDEKEHRSRIVKVNTVFSELVPTSRDSDKVKDDPQKKKALMSCVEMLFAERILFVEGDADMKCLRELRNVALERNETDLSNEQRALTHYTILELGGCKNTGKIAAAQTLSVPCVVLLDDDTLRKTKAALTVAAKLGNWSKKELNERKKDESVDAQYEWCREACVYVWHDGAIEKVIESCQEAAEHLFLDLDEKIRAPYENWKDFCSFEPSKKEGDRRQEQQKKGLHKRWNDFHISVIREAMEKLFDNTENPYIYGESGLLTYLFNKTGN